MKTTKIIGPWLFWTKLNWGIVEKLWALEFYKMITIFLGPRPIFNPPCMWDLMDGPNSFISHLISQPNNSINLNDDSQTQVTEPYKIENANVNEAWMFEPLLVAPLPPNITTTNSFAKLMQKIGGGSTVPIFWCNCNYTNVDSIGCNFANVHLTGIHAMY